MTTKPAYMTALNKNVIDKWYYVMVTPKRDSFIYSIYGKALTLMFSSNLKKGVKKHQPLAFSNVQNIVTICGNKMYINAFRTNRADSVH